MKKALAFICSSLMVLVTYIIFGSLVDALEPTDAKLKSVHEHLKSLALNRTYQVSPNALAEMAAIDKKHSLSTKPFREVCDTYDRELTKLLESKGQLDVNCFAFASYAFNRYREKYAECKFIRMFFEKEGRSPSGEIGKRGHNVLLVPYSNEGIFHYYICDFYSAMIHHNADDYLFVPFETYLNRINEAGYGHIEEIMLISREDPLFFKPYQCLDLRIWFLNKASEKDEVEAKVDKDMAKAIVRLEVKNGQTIHLRIGGFYRKNLDICTTILANLYREVNASIAEDYTHFSTKGCPMVYIWDYLDEMRQGLVFPVGSSSAI